MVAPDTGTQHQQQHKMAQQQQQQHTNNIPPQGSMLAMHQQLKVQTFGDPNDPYVIIQELGGGMQARVYKCRKQNPNPDGTPNTQEFFAVKVVEHKRTLNDTERETQVAHLLKEAEILKNLHHPKIVNLKQVLRDDEHVYLVMEYVSNGDLFDKIAERKGLSEPEAKYVFQQILEALGYMHGQNVIHRDLKPENILVGKEVSVKENDQSFTYFDVKVADFGLSKIVSEDSVAKTHVGTPYYWAPELLRASQSQHRKRNEDNPQGGGQTNNASPRTGAGNKTNNSPRTKQEIEKEQKQKQKIQNAINGNNSGNTNGAGNEDTKTDFAIISTASEDQDKDEDENNSKWEDENKYDSRVDLWSLGVVLYVMLMGHYPFNKKRAMPLHDQILAGLSLTKLQSDKKTKHLSGEVQHLIASLLTADADKRMTLEEIFRHPWCHMGSEYLAKRKHPVTTHIPHRIPIRFEKIPEERSITLGATDEVFADANEGDGVGGVAPGGSSSTKEQKSTATSPKGTTNDAGNNVGKEKKFDPPERGQEPIIQPTTAPAATLESAAVKETSTVVVQGSSKDEIELVDKSVKSDSYDEVISAPFQKRSDQPLDTNSPRSCNRQGNATHHSSSVSPSKGAAVRGGHQFIRPGAGNVVAPTEIQINEATSTAVLAAAGGEKRLSPTMNSRGGNNNSPNKLHNTMQPVTVHTTTYPMSAGTITGAAVVAGGPHDSQYANDYYFQELLHLQATIAKCLESAYLAYRGANLSDESSIVTTTTNSTSNVPTINTVVSTDTSDVLLSKHLQTQNTGTTGATATTSAVSATESLLVQPASSAQHHQVATTGPATTSMNQTQANMVTTSERQQILTKLRNLSQKCFQVTAHQAYDCVAQFGATARRVREDVLPDMQLAIEEDAPELAQGFLETINQWVSEMKDMNTNIEDSYKMISEEIRILIDSTSVLKKAVDEEISQANLNLKQIAASSGAVVPASITTLKAGAVVATSGGASGSSTALARTSSIPGATTTTLTAATTPTVNNATSSSAMSTSNKNHGSRSSSNNCSPADHIPDLQDARAVVPVTRTLSPTTTALIANGAAAAAIDTEVYKNLYQKILRVVNMDQNSYGVVNNSGVVGPNSVTGAQMNHQQLIEQYEQVDAQVIDLLFFTPNNIISSSQFSSSGGGNSNAGSSSSEEDSVAHHHGTTTATRCLFHHHQGSTSSGPLRGTMTIEEVKSNTGIASSFGTSTGGGMNNNGVGTSASSTHDSSATTSGNEDLHENKEVDHDQHEPSPTSNTKIAVYMGGNSTTQNITTGTTTVTTGATASSSRGGVGSCAVNPSSTSKHLFQTTHQQRIRHQSAIALMRAVSALRKVDEILQKSTMFWSHLGLTTGQVSQMKDTLTLWIKYASSNEKLRKRLHERLEQYRMFWLEFERCSVLYCDELRKGSNRMFAFLLQMETRADALDTVKNMMG